MNYEILYRDLKCELMIHKVLIIDRAIYGWMVDVKKIDFIIYIDRKFNWKKKLFILAHETGHFFTIYRNTFKTNALVLTKQANEKIANKRAIKILKILNVKNAEEEYHKFYEWIRGKVFLNLIKDKNTKWKVTKIDPK